MAKTRAKTGKKRKKAGKSSAQADPVIEVKQAPLQLRLPVPRRRRLLKTRVDLDTIVFDGDRDRRAELLSDPLVAETVASASPDLAIGRARRELILSSLRLTARIAPELFGAIEAARDALGIEATIEPYCISSPQMNAFVAPPEDGRVLLGVSSPLLQGMDMAELCFVVGHELGHVLYDHFSMAPSVLFERGDQLSPVQVARLYAWMRYAELSADRVGLVCCQDLDASIRAFFKLTSGLSAPRFLESARESAKQLQELSVRDLESTEEDWFSTHPYGPLRIKAIELFSRSEPYFSVIGRVGGDLSEGQLEHEVSKVMALMDPSFLDIGAAEQEEVRQFVILGGLAVALADGTLDRSEEVVLARLLGDEELTIEPEAFGADPEGRLRELGRHLSLRLAPVRRRKIIEDLAAIALADRHLALAEHDALVSCSELLGVDPRFVDEALGRVARALD